MNFNGILSTLLDVPGALGAAFIDPQGQTVAQLGSPEATEVLGAYQSVWLGELGRLAERTGLGAVSDLSLDFEGKRVLSAQVKSGYFLLVVFDPTGLSSVARARLDDVRRSLAAEVS
jgi:predicted regulator of Ras-like GTPase activity (Roadblock/LC7/MglB family)